MLLLTVIAACDKPLGESATYGRVDYLIVYSTDESNAPLLEALDDLRAYLLQMGAPSVALVPLASASWSELERNAQRGVIVLSGDWFAKQSLVAADKRAAITGDSFVVSGQEANGKRRIELYAATTRAKMYAAYHLAHLLGVRYFHPEEEHVPTTLVFPPAPFEYVEVPTYKYRGFHLHRTHPVELLDDFDATDLAAFRRAKHFIKWLFKNKQNYCGGIGGSNQELNDYARDGGCVRGGGISLTNIQQGGKPLLNPTDPLEVNLEKIKGRLEQIFADTTSVPELFGVSASDTEVFNSDATKDQIYDWFAFTTKWVHDNFPQVYILNNVHITKEEVIPELGVDVNLVHTLLPAYVNLKIHTVMFYGLKGPAPAYGHTTFEDRYQLFDSELSKGRRMWYYPESAWWLTFDNAVPLFLPIYIKMRHEDMQLLDPWVSRGIDGHQTFSTGHEWGYWMTDYCIARMSWAHKVDWKQCLSEIAAPMGPIGATVAQVIVELADYQKETLIERDLMRWVVGEDELAELGSGTDKAAHVVRLPFTNLASYDQSKIDAFRTKDLADMAEMEAKHKSLLERLTAVVDSVEQPGRTIYYELVDGTEIDYLRVRQIRLLYEGLLDAREALLSGNAEKLTSAKARLAEAKLTTEEATTVIRRREKFYRYPLLLSIEGSRDEPVANRTSYPFRIHSDTHTLFFWHRRDKQAADVLAALERQLVEARDVLSTIDKPLQLTFSSLVAPTAVFDFGDGTSSPVSGVTPHSYPGEGIFSTTLKSGDETLLAFTVAVTAKRYRFPMKSLKITSPAEAASTIFLIRGVLPDVFIGDGKVSAFAYDVDRDGVPDLGSVLALSKTPEGFAAFDWRVSLVGQSVTFYEMRLALDAAQSPARLRLQAKLDKQELIRFMVQLGGHIDAASIESILSSIFPAPLVENGRELYPIEAELTASE